ncbi:hypothetical protein [Ornithinibacillus sp. 179-J 7C1 HS]|uniref:hypothetical protein n=1 Tax=Ornithinibacillus sp. 179-J 7C1 HS TaxID=3142384 RepID=UPI0039A02ECA
MLLRKFLVLISTTLLTGLFLNFYFVITEGIGMDNLFFALGMFLMGAFPFILLIGMPVSILSDSLSKNIKGKQRYIEAFLVHITFGLIAGLVISFFFEHFFYVVVTLFAAIIFWAVDEFLRKKIRGLHN